jgi:hypothetical protein
MSTDSLYNYQVVELAKPKGHNMEMVITGGRVKEREGV